jgi:hypothetical protein
MTGLLAHEKSVADAAADGVADLLAQQPTSTGFLIFLSRPIISDALAQCEGSCSGEQPRRFEAAADRRQSVIGDPATSGAPFFSMA